MINQSIRLLIVSLAIGLVSAFDEKQLGYYAFEVAGRNDLPPRVRSPPYLQSNIQCPGVYVTDKYLMQNKDTLCGDLKRGFVPVNPMNVIIQNQHYPFELIKNKTLHFLGKTLPYLREDHENIPKVFKIAQSGNGAYNELYTNMDPNSALPTTGTNYRVKRQAKATITKIDKSELIRNETFAKNLPPQNIPQNIHQNLNQNMHSNDPQTMPNMNAKKAFKGVDNSEQSVPESRQKGCENDGIICHFMQALTTNSKTSNEGSIMSTFSQAYQAYQAYKTAKDFGNFVQSFAGSSDKSDKIDTNEKAANDQYSNRPGFSQFLNAFNTMNGNNQGTTSPPSANGNPEANFNNPLGAIISYFSSSNPSLMARKKKPMEMDDYMNGLTAASSQVLPTVAVKTPEEQIQIAQPTPTACPSVEEYVTPVYARNYQGVWKYVVQVPHEGYFTQTIQKTSCVKNKCDYMDGQCKEASRWVSLLVAEVYYPNAKQPMSNIMPQSSQIKPTIYNEIKLNGQPLAPTYQTNQAGSVDSNMANYDLFNSLLPTNFNEYNHYDQTFARRASKHQASNQMTSQPVKMNYPIGDGYTPQYQETNNNQYQPNYNQFNANQLINTMPHQSSNLKQSNTPLTQAQAKAQFQQLIELYQQQYLQQLAKSKAYNTPNNMAYNGMIDNLSASSMLYPTLVSKSGGGLSQPQLFDSKAINDVKPRSFDSVTSHLLDSTLMKSSYINNEDSLAVASSNNDKMISGDLNANNQATDSNTNSNSNVNEQNETGTPTKENSEECDGYDSNGCYVIRVYYDWFLVNGSCKCWKINKTGSFETLKKIFIGK